MIPAAANWLLRFVRKVIAPRTNRAKYETLHIANNEIGTCCRIPLSDELQLRISAKGELWE